MIRKIVKIDESKCNGCGACANACHENAIIMENGKARLLRDDFCDGFGDCLPACPAGAITIEERESIPYSEEAVIARKQILDSLNNAKPAFSMPQGEGHGCPGSMIKIMNAKNSTPAADSTQNTNTPFSNLRTWPVQIKLLPTTAPFFNNAHLLVAADCTAYAYGNFHKDFIKNRVVLIGCPKLDSVDYTEKLTKIISDNEIKSLTVVRMEVPCCGGLQRACENALRASGKFIPWNVVTISSEGQIIED